MKEANDGWIRVVDELPPHDTPVLCYEDGGMCIDWIDENMHDGPEWNGDGNIIPTHWRPLPAPPSPESTDGKDG
jgi:hypothetical protein